MTFRTIHIDATRVFYFGIISVGMMAASMAVGFRLGQEMPDPLPLSFASAVQSGAAHAETIVAPATPVPDDTYTFYERRDRETRRARRAERRTAEAALADEVVVAAAPAPAAEPTVEAAPAAAEPAEPAEPVAPHQIERVAVVPSEPVVPAEPAVAAAEPVEQAPAPAEAPASPPVDLDEAPGSAQRVAIIAAEDSF